MQQAQCNKTGITLKPNLRIDWKFGHKLTLSIFTEQCHKNSISKSQNGPLIVTNYGFTNHIFDKFVQIDAHKLVS